MKASLKILHQELSILLFHVQFSQNRNYFQLFEQFTILNTTYHTVCILNIFAITEDLGLMVTAWFLILPGSLHMKYSDTHDKEEASIWSSFKQNRLPSIHTIHFYIFITWSQVSTVQFLSKDLAVKSFLPFPCQLCTECY